MQLFKIVRNDAQNTDRQTKIQEIHTTVCAKNWQRCKMV